MNTQKEPVKHVFNVTTHLSYSTTYGVIRYEDDVLLNVTIGIKSDDYGWFEMYDEKTGGDKWYAEGGLWIQDNCITDYDGVFSLPEFIIEKLKEIGYNTEEIE